MGMDLIYVRLSAKSQTLLQPCSECGTSHTVRVLLSIPVPEKLQDKVSGVALASTLEMVTVWAK